MVELNQCQYCGKISSENLTHFNPFLHPFFCCKKHKRKMERLLKKRTKKGLCHDCEKKLTEKEREKSNFCERCLCERLNKLSEITNDINLLKNVI